MPKKNEIEKLIAKYRADIVALEEREEDIMRRIEILENLLPSVLVWYMWKVSQANREVPFPQHENEEEVINKLEHLESVLDELQQADELLKEEENVMRKRIGELETSLAEADQAEEYSEKMNDAGIYVPRAIKRSILDSGQKKETEDLTTEKLEDPGIKFEELLQAEDTDWKKVCEDLIKQVSELNEKLKNSTKKLGESEDYVKSLREEYSMLEKELQSKIELLEKKPERPSEILKDDEEQKKSLQEELESKEALSAMQEALTEVRSIRESLDKSITSKESPIEPIFGVADVQEAVSMPEESPEIQKEVESEDLLPRAAVVSPDEVITPEVGEKLSKVSVEPETALTTERTGPPELAPEIKSESAKSEVSSAIVPEEKETALEGPSLVPEILSPEVIPPPETEIPGAPESVQLPAEPVAAPEVPVVLSKTEVSKESVTLSSEAERPVSDAPITPETSQIPVEPTDTTGALIAPTEMTELKEPTEPETLAAPEESKAPAEVEDSAGEIVLPETKEAISEVQTPEQETPVIPEISKASSETAAGEEDMGVPPEAPGPKEIAEAQMPEPETSVSPEIPKPPSAEAVASAEEMVETPVSKEAIPEIAEAEIPTSEIPVAQEILQESVEDRTSAEGIATTPVAKDSKEAISDIAETAEVPETKISETSITRRTPQIPDETVGTEEPPISQETTAEVIVAALETTEAAPLLAEDQLPLSEPVVGPEIHDISAEGATEETQPAVAQIPETEELPAEGIAVAEDIITSPEITVLKEPISEVAEAQLPLSEKPVVSEPEATERTSSDKSSVDMPVITSTHAEIEPSKTELPPEHIEVEPSIPSIQEPAVSQPEMLVPRLDETVVDETKLPEEVVIPTEVPTEPTEEPTTLKTAADGTEALAMVSEPLEAPEARSRGSPPVVGLKEEPKLLTGKPSMSSLAAQTLQGKLRMKDHLIKSVADELRDLARNNVWAGSNALEAAANNGPAKTYDFDRNILHLYLKGEEPKNYEPSMRADEDSNTNPLNVKIVRKLDSNSLLIEWGPPPQAGVVGFQIYLNGQFKYWIHSTKRNLALLHPLDLKLLLEIAVSPIDVKGDAIFRSTIIYKPE